MKIKQLLLALGLGLLGSAGSAQARDMDVGISLQIGQPGFYGRIDLGDAPRPRVVYAEPVWVQRAPRVFYEPVYLRVPPGHERHWGKHCHRYDACGRPVYFVRDDWYRNVYAPHFYKRHPAYHRDKHDDDDDDRDERHGHAHGHGRDRD